MHVYALKQMLCIFTSYYEIFVAVYPSPHSMLATKLNMSSEEAEKWIVNLIRNAKLDAKIDAKEVSLRPNTCDTHHD